MAFMLGIAADGNGLIFFSDIEHFNWKALSLT
ncbi:hypothetical protein MCEMIEM13_01942 [Comamonadaceae bacterium]|jgi:hypothetical protein